MRTFNLIAARSRNAVIAKDGVIPWKLKGVEETFKELISGNIVIMGRKTYEAIGGPISNCITAVISNTRDFNHVYDEGRTEVRTFPFIGAAIKALPEDKDVYFIGGVGIYEEALRDYVDRMYIMEVAIYVDIDDTPNRLFFTFDEDLFEKTEGPAREEDNDWYNYRYTECVYTRHTSKWKFENSSNIGLKRADHTAKAPVEDSSMEDKIDCLKQRLFIEGEAAIDDFMNGPTCEGCTKDAIENLMDQIIDQMPEEELEVFFKKYDIN